MKLTNEERAKRVNRAKDRAYEAIGAMRGFHRGEQDLQTAIVALRKAESDLLAVAFSESA